MASRSSSASLVQSTPEGDGRGRRTIKVLSGVTIAESGRSVGSRGKLETICTACTVVATGTGGWPSSRRMAYSRSL